MRVFVMATRNTYRARLARAATSPVGCGTLNRGRPPKRQSSISDDGDLDAFLPAVPQRLLRPSPPGTLRATALRADEVRQWKIGALPGMTDFPPRWDWFRELGRQRPQSQVGRFGHRRRTQSRGRPRRCD